MARRLRIEVGLEGYFVEEHCGDDSGFVSDAQVEKAQAMLSHLKLDPVPGTAIAAIIASTIRNIPE